MRPRGKTTRAVAIGLTSLLLVATAGCGNGDAESAPPAQSSSSPTPSATPMPSATPTPRPTPSPRPAATSPARPGSTTEMSAEDKSLLRTLLGPGAGSLCTPSAATRVECGRVWAATSKVVGVVQAALEGMPKTTPYVKFATSMKNLQGVYGQLKSTGCFGAKPPKNQKSCTDLAKFGSFLISTSSLRLY